MSKDNEIRMDKMSYFALCSFDLRNTSHADYQAAYADLAQIGFSRKVRSSQGQDILLPTTTTAGEFTGTGVAAVRDNLRDRVRRAFAARRFTSEIFVSVGDNWCWGYDRT
jgi:hypothetical protein